MGLDVFFDALSADYDDSILKAVPIYADLLQNLVDSVPFAHDAALEVLELGCGTGNVSLALGQRFPKARLTLVDLSNEMLSRTVEKLRGHGVDGARVQPVHTSFTALPQNFGRFDLVISCLALHHLTDAEKHVLYRQLAYWLKPGGVFRCADQCLGLPADTVHAWHNATWQRLVRDHGATDDDLAAWQTHFAEHDHYTPLFTHFTWLAEAGLAAIDCYWRRIYWAIYGAQAPLRP
jgi:tRNA (cmo5U34)-methyltransferase